MDGNKLLDKFDELDLPNEFCNQITKKFPQFVIYKKHNKYRASAHCTACDKNFTATDGEGDYGDVLAADNYPCIGEVKHKNDGRCPCCGKKVRYLSYGQLSKVYVYKENFVVFSSCNGMLYMECLLVRQFFESGNISYEFERKARYVAYEGGWKKWIWKWLYIQGRWKQQWSECVTLGEPHFQNGFGYGYADNTYYPINEAAISRVSFCRSKKAFDEAGRGCRNALVTYCCLSAVKPGIEALLNGGCGDIALSYLQGDKHGVRLKLNSNNPKTILGLNSEELKKIQSSENQLAELARYKFFKKNIVIQGSFEKKWDVFSCFKLHLDDIIDIKAATHLTDTAIINYIDKQSELYYNRNRFRMIIEWKDYLRQCIDLDYDRTETAIIKPKNLLEAHHKLTELIKYHENEKMQQKIEELRGWREQLRFSSGDLIVIEPATAQEIIDEGKTLHHCVGGYAKDHAEGTTNIMFLRKKDDPKAPYYTIEVDTRGNIRQCYGAYNNRTDLGGVPKPQAIKDFQTEYAKHLKKVFAKAKKHKNSNRIRIGA